MNGSPFPSWDAELHRSSPLPPYRKRVVAGCNFLCVGALLALASCAPPRPVEPPRDPLQLSANSGIERRVQTGRVWRCPEPFDACATDYLNLSLKLQGGARPRSDEQLKALLNEPPQPRDPGATDPEELRRVVRQALRADLLLDPARERPLQAVQIAREQRGDLSLTRLLLIDPVLGEIHLHQLSPPPRAERRAGVLLVHGHSQRGDSLIDFGPGRRLAEAGFVVVAPTFRVNAGDEHEARLTWELLRDDLPLAGVRLAEQRLALRYLRSLEAVDAQRVGVLGHSGGSILSALSLRLEDPPAAWVGDALSGYRNPWGEAGWLDETVPALTPWSAALNNLTTIPVPTLQVPYGPADVDGILEFFRKSLRSD